MCAVAAAQLGRGQGGCPPWKPLVNSTSLSAARGRARRLVLGRAGERSLQDWGSGFSCPEGSSDSPLGTPQKAGWILGQAAGPGPTLAGARCCTPPSTLRAPGAAKSKRVVLV